MKSILKRIPITFLITFLFTFMLLIFGPSEIFFANVTEFQFVYGEFAGRMAGCAVIGAVLLTAILIFWPDKIYRTLLAVIFGLSLAGYLQVMFFNKNLDLLGVNPKGYQPKIGPAIGNLAIWIVVTAAVVAISLWKKEIGRKIVLYGASFLLCIQMAALVSLLVTARENAFKHPEKDGTWHLSGEDQYTVSADKNIIVLVLDYFSNQYLEPLEAAYPGATDFLHDFTYYSNVDCTYFGTYPSLAHMLTGNEMDMSCGVNEWCEQIWNSEKAESFYSLLAENDYVANVYTPDTNVLCGTNDVKLLEGRLSNVVNSAQEIVIDYKLLYHTIGKMSAYRMAPDFLKPEFYTKLDEYSNIVTAKENKINHNNYDFYADLQQKGLKADKSSNYYIVQHLMGWHENTTDEFGNFKADATTEETAKGCMVIVEEYLNQLKELNVYDDAAIIVTADHGDPVNSQVIFYMKEAGETHEASPITNAPVSLQEFLPTIAEAVGLDYTQFGQSVHDFSEGELRERTYWLRWYNEEYPAVSFYAGDKKGVSNVYYGYTYTGDSEELRNQVGGGQAPAQIVELVDSYF